MSEENESNYEVGYGKPPTASQFKKGESGNPNGRPKKPDPAIINLADILQNTVTVNGNPMDSRAVELRQQIKKALDPKGSLKSIIHVLSEFEKYGAIKAPAREQQALELPSMMDVPWAIQRLLLEQGLPPPWKKKQIAKAKRAYLSERSEGDRLFDVEAGYEEWLTK